ncbi:alpha/beta hydrolase [Roseibacillus persicicus]|uniref:alpha/beta hydrolase fold domain-containing protein n=1 Tax=Roseibacillus persicicus TaxID=454148 RepID=UPI00398B8C83
MKKNIFAQILFRAVIGYAGFASLLAADEAKSQPLWKKGIYHESVPEPTNENVRYGPEHRNVLDFWKAPSDKPTPVVISIHGGGWNGGDKVQLHSFVDSAKLLESGISVAAINYRLIKHCRDLDPPVQGPLSDAARAVQFIRSRAEDWNIDKTRIAATGGSAGACTSLWLAYHDDLADPTARDPVARESTRLMCVAAIRAQTTLNPKQMKSWIPNSKYGAHAFGLEGFEKFLAERDRLLPVINQYSPVALLDVGDADTYLFYPIVPPAGKVERDPTHSAVFGVELQKHCLEKGVPCELVYPGAPEVRHEDATAYLIDRLKSQ